MPQQLIPIEKNSYVLYPHKALFFDSLFRSKMLFGLLLAFAVPAAVVLFLTFEKIPRHLMALRPWAMGSCLIVASIFLGYTLLQLFAFRRVRYVFSPLGIRVEGGIVFHSDLVSWVQINDINVSASLTEQCFGCATLIVGTYKFGPQFIRFVANFKDLRAYLEAQLQKNLGNARTINPI